MIALHTAIAIIAIIALIIRFKVDPIIALVLGIGVGLGANALLGIFAPLIPSRIVPSTFAIAAVAAVVAIAAKNARMAWATLAKGESFKPIPG